ncbi:MAG: acyl carrier protein [Dyella sp.]|uniref:acyl carrier protein n=1 Tax=Dyella sp. TaxID=1869338 RepID=UPI003F7E17CF
MKVLQEDVEKLTELVRQVTNDTPPIVDITEQTRFVEDLGLESINRLMLITLIEQAFGVDLEKRMSQMVDLHTVGEVATFVRAIKAAP